MRTTIDLPDSLMRELKARAALEGLKLKDYVARLVEHALQRPALATPHQTTRSRAPVFRREGAQPMPALSNARLSALLDVEGAAKVSTIARPKRKGKGEHG